MTNEFKIKSNYSFRDDLLIVTISNNSNKEKEIKLDDNFNLIFNKEGIPLFLEINNASKVFNVKKLLLKNIYNVDIIINVEEDIISLNSNFTLTEHNRKKEYDFNFEVLNSKNIPKL
jgi:hypothetical protein